MVGSRIVRQVDNCTKDIIGGELHRMFCDPNLEALGLDPKEVKASDLNSSYLESLTDPKLWTCDSYYEVNEAKEHQGIRGIQSGIFKENVGEKYRDAGDAISSNDTESEYNLGGEDKRGYIVTDIATAFTILVGIFFPSCTGE